MIKENYNSKVLVEMWADFIDWEKRRKGENGFLKQKLVENNVHKIFESCLGDGCDTIYLLKEGFEVISNDLDKEFIKKAQQNAKKENVKLNITSYDWRKLAQHFEKESFDAVLCLGNSITYLFDKKDQIETLNQFKKMLRKNGTLIIDERNYEYFLNYKEEILKGNFEYSGKYVYCGNNVHGYPIEIENDKIVMEYYDPIRKKKGNLTLYPFKKGELLELLKEAGFTKIKQYADYSENQKENPDFFQYVCKK